MKIKVNNLSYRYNKHLPDVLDNISFEINSGITVLLGLNGCGKTTLIKLLAGVLENKDNNIYYDDKNINDISYIERSKIFSYVSQKSSNADDYYVKDYLTYGFVNSLKFYQSPSNKQLENVSKIAKEFGISHLLDKKISQISGGERQIVSIASCILQNTPIILLDEPTSALDLSNQNLVLTLLKKISLEGKTIILSSHNPNHALFLDSNVFLLNNGKIIKEGYSKDLINVDTLKDIYGDSITYSDELPYKEISFN